MVHPFISSSAAAVVVVVAVVAVGVASAAPIDVPGGDEDDPLAAAAAAAADPDPDDPFAVTEAELMERLGIDPELDRETWRRVAQWTPEDGGNVEELGHYLQVCHVVAL